MRDTWSNSTSLVSIPGYCKQQMRYTHIIAVNHTVFQNVPTGYELYIDLKI